MKGADKYCTLLFCIQLVFLTTVQLEAAVWPISGLSYPFADTATSPFGIRRTDTKICDHHAGLDLRADGHIVHSTEDAVIKELHAYDGQNGNWVRTENLLWPDMVQYLHLYMWEIGLHEGDTVLEGGWIGYSGSTGGVDPHLHYGYIATDDGDNGPRQNPVVQLTFTDMTCPDMYCQGDPVVTYTGQGKIDYINLTTCVPADELDFSDFRVWLYRTDGHEVANIFTDDQFSKGDNNVDDEEPDGNFIFFLGDPDYELSIECRPRTFLVGHQYHIIDWKVDPSNNEIFLDERFIGISVDDAQGDFDCHFESNSANWGNITGESPLAVLSNFRAQFLGRSQIKLSWDCTPLSIIEGLHLYRSRDSLVDYVRVTPEALQLDGTHNIFIDSIYEPRGTYYYKYSILYKDGHTVLSSEMATVVVSVPVTFKLAQNFPNPFNPTTIIEYSLSSSDAGYVELRVFNVLGQYVKTLVDKIQGEGFYRVTWDGTDDKGKPVASGVYLYSLKTEKLSASKKMLLLK